MILGWGMCDVTKHCAIQTCMRMHRLEVLWEDICGKDSLVSPESD